MHVRAWRGHRLESFSAKIFKIGINPVVDPPDKVLEFVFEQAGKSKGPIPVRGRLNGAEFIQTLVKYKGAWRLYINGEMLKASGLSVDDTANVEIEFDPRPREVPVPPKFAKALKDDKTANAEFDKLTPGRKKEILRYLGFLKSEDALDRNIDRVLKHLRGENAETLHALMKKEKPRK
jgi:hypothetical protein